jgi:four helix bundle protein
MKNFKKLMIWQKGMELVTKTYLLTGQMPNEEKYGLRSQVTRAAVSIPSNIAEGSAKRSKKEYIKFLEIALGSAYELETQVLIIENLNYGDSDLRKLILSSIDEEQKMIQSFINTVEDS